jgi:signal transduction histidine kinase
MMKVLVVDGSPGDRQAIVDALNDLDNVAVHGAVADVSSAMRALVAGQPDIDVVVTGAPLDGGDSLELIEATRRCEPAPSIVVIGQDSSRAEWQRHLDAGADRFVARDPQLHKLREVVAELASHAAGAELEDPIRLLGRMSAGVLHDLNNYLSVIGVIIKLLARAPTAAHWQEAQRALSHATALTRSVLDYARGTAPDLGSVDLATIVRDVMRIVTHAISPEIVLMVVGVSNIALVRGAAPQLGQLALNLVLNAADAMPDGGILTVIVWTTPDGAVRLDVSDTGSGIAIDGAAQLASVWTPSTKGGRTTGLGLGVVREVAHMHRAAFTLTVLEHGGTVATVVFPLLTERPTASA